jgi:hypothetical protein
LEHGNQEEVMQEFSQAGGRDPTSEPRAAPWQDRIGDSGPQRAIDPRILRHLSLGPLAAKGLLAGRCTPVRYFVHAARDAVHNGGIV